MSGIQVVLGASGGTGNAVARALADRGHGVHGVNREPFGPFEITPNADAIATILDRHREPDGRA